MQQQGINIQLQQHEMEIEVAKAEAQMMGQLMQQLSPPPAGPDPLIQLQQQGLQLKGQELQQKGQVEQAKLGLENQKLQHKVVMDQQKTQSLEDIAQLRANIALERVNANKAMR